MKITHLILLTLVLGFAACTSDSNASKDKNPPAKTTAKSTNSSPNPGTAGNPIAPTNNGQYNGVDPMSNGVDGKMYNKNY